MNLQSLEKTIDEVAVPVWRKIKIKSAFTFSIRHLTDEEIQTRKQKIIDFAKANPMATRKDIYKFLRTV